MKNKEFKNMFILSMIVMNITLFSCHKENFKDHAGPSICPSDDFAYSVQPTINSASLNLNTDTLKITASFNEDISWSVLIRGLTSKSYKKYSGYGSEININWNGTMDTLVFFQAEPCEAIVKIACLPESEAITLPFTITAKSNFSYNSYLVYNGDVGSVAVGGPYIHGAYITHGAVSNLNSPQGGNCFCSSGSSALPTWYFGGYGFDVNVSTALNTDPAKVYFNCFVNVKGTESISVPVITFTEDGIARSKYVYVTGPGWHYFSFPLSDANVLDPKKITQVGVGLNAYPVQGTSGEMCFDFMLFTNDGPFIGSSTSNNQ